MGTETDPPPAVRSPTLAGLPVPPAQGSAPMPSEAPGTRRSATDLPAWPGHCESVPPSADVAPSPPTRPAVERQAGPPESHAQGNVGRVLRALGPAAPITLSVAVVIGVTLWALGGGEGVARVIDAWRRPSPVEQTALEGLAARVSELERREERRRVALRQHLLTAAEADVRSRCAIAAVLEAQGASVPGLCEAPPELLPAPNVRPGTVRRGGAPVVQPDTSVPPVPVVPEMP